MEILVDADACPVKEIIVKHAKLRKIKVTMVIDTSHELNDGYSTIITVDKARDSADIRLINLVKKGDIVVTQDYGVAAMAISKGAYAINQNGLKYSDNNIDRLLFERHIGQKVRRSGGRTFNMKKRTKENDDAFECAFLKLLSEGSTMIIRQETEKDYKATEEMIKQAFLNVEHSSHDEQFLVARLRKMDNFVPEFSLVAEIAGQIAGHILFSKIQIINDDGVIDALSLAPLSVSPLFQNQGVGSALIKEGLKIIVDAIVILLGHKDYYTRFGFVPSVTYHINAPFDVPEENFMVWCKDQKKLQNISGIVKYPDEFEV